MSTVTDLTSSPLWSLFVSAFLLIKSLTSILKCEWQQQLISVKTEPWITWMVLVVPFVFTVSKHTRAHICSKASPHGLHPMWTYLLMKSICSAFLCMRAARTSKEIEGMVPTYLTSHVMWAMAMESWKISSNLKGILFLHKYWGLYIRWLGSHTDRWN